MVFTRRSLALVAATVGVMSFLPLASNLAAASSPSPPGLGWWYGNQESYLFPGVAGMSSQTTSFGYYLNNPANVTITVLNASNQVVKTIQSGVSESNYYDGVSWDGTDDQGQTVAPGQYTIDIDASNQGGESTLTAVRDVANPGSPGALTSPTNGATLSGTAGFVFTPSSTFPYTITEVDVNCIGSSYAPSSDGTWQGSGDTSGCQNGSVTLSDTVAFTDPLGGTQSWSDPNAPTVTISNGPGLGWWYGNQESYLFPGVAGMSSQTTSFGYYLNNPANVTITVLNASNQVVKTIQSGVSESNYYDGVSWDGTDDQGQTVAPGQYTIDIDASNQGGESTLTAVRDVANPGSPGALTSPTNGATLSGTAGFVFTPSSTFPYTITEVDVNCIGSSYAPSSDGTWQGSGDTSGCQNGSVTLSDTVAFTDPLGGTQSWSDPNAPTVTISNGPGLGWWYGNQESYLFPGVAGMSSQTTSFGYYLNNPANVTITVLNASNQVVKTIQSGVSESNYYDGVSWDGTDDQGQTVAPGQYTIDIDASNQGGESTLTAVRDVANPGSPGALTSPTNGATLSGTAGFVFTPSSTFPYTITEVDVNLHR